MDGSQFNHRDLNPFARGFTQRDADVPVGQQTDETSLQASFEQQLSQLQTTLLDEGAGGIRSADLRQDPFSGPTAATPGPGPNSGRQQPLPALNRGVSVGAKRGRSEPFTEDKELVSAIKKAARETKISESGVNKLGHDLHHLSHWLRQENRGPIAGRLNIDAPGHASFVADVQDYLRNGGRFAVVAQLNTFAPGSLPSPDELMLPAEDADLLARFRVDAEQRKMVPGAVNNSVSGLRLFIRWLRDNNRDPLASQLRGGSSLDNEIAEYRSLGRDPRNRVRSALNDLRRLLRGGAPEPRGVGVPRHLTPHPEDAPLIEGALDQALNDLKNPTAELRQVAQARATRLRALSQWLRENDRGSIAGRLNGSNKEQLALHNDVIAFKLAGKRVYAPDLSHLRSYLRLIEANRALSVQARERSASPAVLAGRPNRLQVLPAPGPSEGGGAFLNEVVQESASPSAARARSDTYAGLESFVDLNPPTPSELRGDADFAPAQPGRARSDTYAGLQSFVDLNAEMPSELRDDADFSPAHPGRDRSDTYAGLESFVDLNAPTPSELRDDADFAPADPGSARSDTYAGLESFVDLNAPTPSELRDDADFAPADPGSARSDTYAGLESFVDLNAPTPSELRDDADFAPPRLAGARSDTYAGLDSLVDLNAPTPSELRDDAHFASAHAARARSDTYAGLESLVDLNAPTPSELDDEADPARPFPAPLSDAQLGGLNLTAPSRDPGLVLGDTQWLGDEHIQRDYELLERWLRENHPDLAVRTQLVDPLIAHYQVRLAAVDGDARGRFQRLIDRNGNDTADFLFLPMNDADRPRQRGTHWSLLFVDRRNRQRPVAYHYDSIRGYNDARAAGLANRLGLSFRPADMAEQQNSYDCGVFVVDGTRALLRGLATGQPDPLNLKNLGVSRPALQNRLRS